MQAKLLVEGDQRALHGGRFCTTREMLYSEEPWAMAMMLTFSRPRAVKVRPATPGMPRMFSPTTATMATSGLRGDVLDGLLGDFWGKGVTQGFDGALLVRAVDYEADVVLR